MFVFILWNSPFLGVFGWICDTLLRASLVGPCSEVNDGNMCTLWRRRWKSHSSNWRHERRRAQKRHLATKRLETLEKWRRRKPVSLNMEFNAPRKRIGCGDVANLGNAHVWRTTLRIHSSSCATRNWFQKKTHVDAVGELRPGSLGGRRHCAGSWSREMVRGWRHEEDPVAGVNLLLGHWALADGVGFLGLPGGSPLYLAGDRWLATSKLLDGSRRRCEGRPLPSANRLAWFLMPAFRVAWPLDPVQNHENKIKMKSC